MSGAIFVSYTNKVIEYIKTSNNTNNNTNQYKLINSFTIKNSESDSILNFHITNKHLIIITKELKNMMVYNRSAENNTTNTTNSTNNNSIIKFYSHAKKFSNSLLYMHTTPYIIFSDKFGEIYLKDILAHETTNPSDSTNVNTTPNTTPTNTTTNEESTKGMLYGHSDIISYLRFNCNNTKILSSDTLGKIKIADFPNVFNIQSVILYENYLYVNFLSEKFIFVLDTNLQGHVWETKTYTIRYRYDFSGLDEIVDLQIMENTILVRSKELVNIYRYSEEKNNITITTSIKIEDDSSKKVMKDTVLNLSTRKSILVVNSSEDFNSSEICSVEF